MLGFLKKHLLTVVLSSAFFIPIIIFSIAILMFSNGTYDSNKLFDVVGITLVIFGPILTVVVIYLITPKKTDSNGKQKTDFVDFLINALDILSPNPFLLQRKIFGNSQVVKSMKRIAIVLLYFATALLIIHFIKSFLFK